MKVYKLFRQKNNKIEPTPIGVWLEAKSGLIIKHPKNIRKYAQT